MARFKKPGWTQFPNEIFDQLMPVLSGAQFKILCLIARQTAGWHKDREQLSLVQIMQRTGLSKQGTVDSIKALEEKEYIVKGGGVLRSKTEKPESCWYELNVDESQGEQGENGTVNSFDRSVEMEQSTQLTVKEGETVKSLDCSTVNSVDPLIRSKETNKEIEEKKEDQVPEFDLQPGTPPLEFLKNAYRQSRGSKFPTNTDLKRFRIPERVSECEASYGEEEFRTAAWRYLGQSSDWLRENKWPLAAFLKNMESCGAYEVPRSTPQKTTPPPAIQQELPGTEPPACPILDIHQIADRYHELAPHAPRFFLSRGSKPDFPGLHDPEFFRDMDDVFRKIESLWATGRTANITWLNLAWVLQSKSGLLNWNKLMSGSIDCMVREESGGRSGTSAMTRSEVDALGARVIAKLKLQQETKKQNVQSN